jgi:hypothetical protein
MTVRAFYAELGIELADGASREAPVRCFARPEAHSNGDHSPSCSVNLQSGAWNCHGCGAGGGPYDAALAAGRTPRQAMELLTVYGLVRPTGTGHRARAGTGKIATSAERAFTTSLGAQERDIERWAERLDSDCQLIRRLILERGWAPSALRTLGIGLQGSRITIPIRNTRGDLRGVLRYDPFGDREPKMLAIRGTRLGLVPHPAKELSDRVILVEGPPDMIAARSAGLPAIAVPGTSAWQPAWARLLADRRVTIVMDCDTPGRRAAREVAASLAGVACSVHIIDLCPGRADGYDLTDRILERRRTRQRPGVPRSVASLLNPAQPRRLQEPGS